MTTTKNINNPTQPLIETQINSHAITIKTGAFHMLNRLLSLLLLLALTPSAWADPAVANRLHEIRTHGFLLCSNLLVYFNNHDPDATFDPDAKDAYQQNLTHLQRMVDGLPENPEIAGSLQKIKSAIDYLEQQPQDRYEQYSRLINPILREHGVFDKAVGAAYATAHSADPTTDNLHQQSLDTSRMLLLYETQAFIGLGIYTMEFHEDIFQEIDQRISARHATLVELLPQLKGDLEKVHTDYNFIRSRLLSPEQTIVPRSAAIYLGRGVTRLNSLASTNIVSARQ